MIQTDPRANFSGVTYLGICTHPHIGSNPNIVTQDDTIFDNSTRIDGCIRTDLRCVGNNRLFMNTA